MTENPISMKKVVSRMLETKVSTGDPNQRKSILEANLKHEKIEYPYLYQLMEDCKTDETYVSSVLLTEKTILNTGKPSIYPMILETVCPNIKNHARFMQLLKENGLPEEYATSAEKVFKETKSIDRTINNHRNIAKHVNIDSLLVRYEHSDNGAYDFIDSICETVSKFKAPNYALLNSALEEVLYLNHSMGMAIPKSYCVETVTNYFLSIPFAESDIPQYQNVLRSNKYITENDCRNISFLFESETYANSDDVPKLIAQYKKSEEKSPKMIENIMRKLYSKGPEHVIDGLPTVFGLMRAGLVFGLFAVNPIIGLLTLAVDQFLAFSYKKNDINRMIKIFEKEMKATEKKMDKVEYDSQAYKDLESYSKKLEVCKDKLEEEKGKLYTDAEMDNERNFLEFASTRPYVRLEEFKLFPFNNLLKKAGEANKYISTVYSRAKEAIKDKFNDSIFRPIDENEIDRITLENVVSHIDKVTDLCSICVEVFEYSDEEFAHEQMTKICQELNGRYGDKFYQFYYENNMDGLMDLYVRSAYPIVLSEKEEAEQADMFANIDLDRVCNFRIINELDDDKAFFESNLIPTEEYIIAEAKVVQKVKNVAAVAKASAIKTGQNLSRAKENGEDNVKPDNLLKGVNLNGVRLAMEGLRKKFKDGSSKEKEVSRNLDYTVDNFVRSVQKAMTNDRREAIITGSVIPSFSKTLKIALGVSALGVVNPYLAMIAVVGGLANSKRLNQKEKNLLMDEIEIELKIVEKEISMAENDGDTKRLRTLMQYQKKLQRENQRIKYNMKVSWSPMNSIRDAAGKPNLDLSHNTVGRNYGIGKED